LPFAFAFEPRWDGKDARRPNIARREVGVSAWPSESRSWPEAACTSSEVERFRIT